jgi:hypothetical protein
MYTPSDGTRMPSAMVSCYDTVKATPAAATYATVRFGYPCPEVQSDTKVRLPLQSSRPTVRSALNGFLQVTMSDVFTSKLSK